MENIENLIEKQPNVKSLLLQIGEIAEQKEKEVYAVGGVVRDLLLDKEIHEVDLMVVGDGIEFAKIIANELGIPKIVPFHRFSTAHIPANPIPIEVAAAREEIYSSESRKPKKVKYTDLAGDLIRRDFTINAMAINIVPEKFGNLHDPYNGIKDLEAKKLITPLDPNKTFSEDPLRMIRAAYFASKLNLNIEKNCVDSMKQQSERISIVSQRE